MKDFQYPAQYSCDSFVSPGTLATRDWGGHDKDDFSGPDRLKSLAGVYTELQQDIKRYSSGAVRNVFANLPMHIKAQNRYLPKFELVDGDLAGEGNTNMTSDHGNGPVKQLSDAGEPSPTSPGGLAAVKQLRDAGEPDPASTAGLASVKQLRDAGEPAPTSTTGLFAMGQQAH